MVHYPIQMDICRYYWSQIRAKVEAWTALDIILYTSPDDGSNIELHEYVY